MKGFGDISPKQMEALTAQMQEGLEMVKTEVASIPEHVFKQHLLPVLIGSADGTPVSLEIWTDIAGVTFRPINVTAPNGEVMFQVPPLHRRLPTEVRDGSVESVQRTATAIVTKAHLMARNSPRAGMAYMARALHDKVPHTAVDMERVRQFDAILRRYGHPGLGIAPSTSQDSAVTPTDGKPEIEVFDEFDF